MIYIQTKVFRLLLPLVLKTCNTLFDITFLPSKSQNWKRITQALSVPLKHTFCIYIKCLIVICSEVTIERRSGKQGESLACQF